jgi:signal transduction histidine kinase/Tfp pilus assembly protein PilF
MSKNILLSLLISAFISCQCNAQNEKQIDSLLKVISITKNDSVKIGNYNKIAWHFVFSDTSQAKRYLLKSENIALKNKKSYGYNEIMNLRGIMMDIKGKTDSAKFYFEKTLKLSRKNHHKVIEVRSINNLGMLNWNQGNYKKALNYFLEGLKLNEYLSDDKKIKNAIFYNNIGLIYQELNLNHKALAYHIKAYEARKKDNQLKEQASSLNNIGICYNAMNKNKEALESYKKGLKIALDSNNLIDYYKITENIGNALQSQKKYKESISYYEKILQMKDSVSINPKTFLGVYTGLTSAYNEIENPSKALLYGKKGLEVLEENPAFKHYSFSLFQQLANSYYRLGEITKGDYYTSYSVEILKNKFSSDNAKSIADLEIKYQTATKEKLLAENKTKLLKNEIETQNKNALLIGLIILIVFVTLISIFIFRQQKLKRKQEKQEFQLKNAITKIETQNKLQKQRLTISRDLHDNIGAQLTFIISSVDNIKYSFPVVDLILDKKLNTISEFTKSTIQELRDTIWAMNSNEITFEDLHSRILNFIEKAQKSQDSISFNFQIPLNLNTIKLSSVVGMNLYRTIQEAVNNAIKHANPKNISIEINAIKNDIQIIICDNGIGFDETLINKGNGLINMEKRMEEIGGTIRFGKNESGGTQIELNIKKTEKWEK